MRKDIEIEQYICPCGTRLNAGQYMNGPERRKPYPGEVMICRNCFALYIWGNDDKMHPATEEDIRRIKAVPMKWFKIQMAIRDLQSKNSTMN
jgi:hypothetical protein